MKIIEDSQRTKRAFDIETHLKKPLFAHLATSCPDGPRESPVWFLWEEETFWIIGHETSDSFPKRIKADSRVAMGIVDFDPRSGKVHHLGVRGRGLVAPFDRTRVKKIFTKYLGADVSSWDKDLTEDVVAGNGYLFVKIVPETVVVRDQSYDV